ncbi:AraC family transcriptional regulator [Halopseudomonas salegens]|uniref:AraC-type DNA-binding protein n=1 Tax=Halopseudomonas salegens TaxID=1434072 RepID=A0A1H2E2A4_9GAMM|nr:AraC family transcriptional regulator [Halopseudomonas salegens]SDT89227.1 AraC-type DNA-binding protein [Halopseudomonas salegens]
MIELVKRLAPTEGYTQSLLDDVTFMRANRAIPVTPALYEPSIVIVLQGKKRGFYGGQRYIYDAGHYLALSVPLPFLTETEASETEPMLGLVLRINQAVTAQLALDVDKALAKPASKPATLFATPLDDKLEDATLRLLEALSSPLETAVLAPSIFREITYRVLISEQGGGLRAALLQNGNFGRIANVLRYIHTRYAQSLNVGVLASEANMSIPAFHSHFKAVTDTSPLQYIKAIRLHQARLLMIREGCSAVIASQYVGYESASQFSREFKRLFGRSPVEEARHLKQVLAMTPQTHGRAPSARP